MSTKTYTVRVPQATPDITSEDVASWLDAQQISNAPLHSDPGPGERSLRISLEQDKVKNAAQAVGEPEAVFLRRLIASNVPVPKEEVRELEARPKTPVLKGTLKLQAEQVRPLVLVLETAQSFVIRKAFKCPEAVDAAAYTEEERSQLSSVTSEVINRRAPRVLVENIDLVGLVTTVAAIEMRKIEAVR